jgi:DNA-binding SARP family transcriptional activator/tetratricopeptide (TPR) repeat protein
MLRFTVLGAVRAWRGEAELDLGPPQQRAILALLLARGGQPTSLSELVDLLWRADPPASAVNIVHRYVGMLRRVLEPGLPSRAAGRWLVRRAGGYRVAADAGALDLLRFRELAGQGREAAAHGLEAQAVPLFAAALALGQGPCADGVAAVWEHPSFTAVDHECLAVTREAADAALAAGLAGQVLPALRQAAGRHPLAEPVHARLMLALAAAGSQAEALAVYETARARLADHLGLDPGAELREAHGRVLRQQATAAPVGDRPLVRPAQLPADLAAFAGRRAETAYVSELLTPQAAQPIPAVVIDGMPGAGKTALAVHCAHAVADRYPDGQLYVNLRGFALGEAAVSPAEALRGFIATLGVPPQRVPSDLDGLAALYRSLLAGQRMLVVLDNARDDDHARPLLPGAPGCAAIVTSRNCLTGLVARDGARLLSLDVFSPAEAREALSVRLGADRVTTEPEAAAEIASLSGRLPLALALVAARAAARPRFPLSVVSTELRGAQGSLDAFSDTGLPDVRTVFFWSYRLLSPEAARMFRMLSLAAGPDISLAAAASLLGAPHAKTRVLLAELTWARLLNENRPQRYSIHDLLRSYAAELCVATDTGADRQAARSRLYSYYLHSAHQCFEQFRPHEQVRLPDPAEPGVRPEQPGNYAAALGWLTAEQRILEATIRYAAQHGFAAYAWRLAYRLPLFYQRKGFWHDWAATARTALDAAYACGDVIGQVQMHRMLAGAFYYLRDSSGALAGLERARELYAGLGCPDPHPYLDTNFGSVLARLGRYDDAIAHHRRAFELYRAAGFRLGEAFALQGIGSCANRLGDHEQAIVSVTEALRIYQELDHPGGEAYSMASLARSYHLVGYHERAAQFAVRALELHRAMGSGAEVAKVLTTLGDIRLATGDRIAADALFRPALAILDELRLPQADDLRDRLARTTGQPGAPARIASA